MKKYSVIIIIFIIAVLLRFVYLGKVPDGFHKDEAFLGYNAYSLLKTGRSINGAFLPFHLKSFLYSPAGYSYMSIPFIVLFGLNEFSVRFASFLFGTLTVLLVYLLTKILLNKNEKLAFIAAFLFAISPWHIILSRTATENIPATFFILLGILWYFHWRKGGKKNHLILVFILFELSYVLYQAPRAFLPIFFPWLIYCYKPLKDKYLVGLFYVLLLIVPVFYIVFSPTMSLRIRTVSILNTPESILRKEEGLREDGVMAVSPIVARIFHNDYIELISLITENYFKHFSYNFFFTDKSFPLRYRIYHHGIMYVSDLLLLLVGITRLFIKKRKTLMFLIGWILLSPVGSALTHDDIPNMQRTLFMLPPLILIISYGIYESYLFIMTIANKKLRFSILMGGGLIFVYMFLQFIHFYFTHQNIHKPLYRNEGYRDLVKSVSAYKRDYDRIIVTNREAAPTIFFLFYTKYDPALFQKEAKKSSVRDYDRISFDSYIFSTDSCPLNKNTLLRQIKNKDRLLYVNHATCPYTIPGITLLKEIKRQDETVVFRIVTFSQ